jgi:hypothetical protein
MLKVTKAQVGLRPGNSSASTLRDVAHEAVVRVLVAKSKGLNSGIRELNLRTSVQDELGKGLCGRSASCCLTPGS